jgi:sugar lactone lactonase YvrE
MYSAELCLDAKATLGEGPVWDVASQTLLWVDIEGRRLHFYHPASQRVIELPEKPGCVVPDARGGLVLALKNRFARLDPATEQLRVLCTAEPERAGQRFNDGKCDPAGRFWAGTMTDDWSKPGTAALYCLYPDHSCRQMLVDITCSNGLAWSLDARTMYYIDSASGVVAAFDYDLASGAIANRRVVIEHPRSEGILDGMTIDEEGMLWIALWDGGCVSRWDPASGRMIGKIPLPASRPTSCTFGGAGLDELTITSARIGLTESQLAEQPLAGGLFRATVGVRGFAPHVFAG